MMMKNISQLFEIIKKPVVITLLLFIIQISIYLNITAAPYRIVPPGTTYNASWGYDAEYVSYIRQGALGYWSVQENRGTRPSPRVYAYPLFILLGKLSAVTGLNPMLVYQLSKIAGGICIFLTTYTLVKVLIPSAAQGIALLLMLGVEVGTYLPVLFSGQGVDSPLFGMSIAVRHFGLPHHTIGSSLAILFLLTYIFCIDRLTLRRGMGLAILGALSTAFVLPFVLIMSVTMGFSYGILSILRRRFRAYIVPTIIAALAVGLTAAFYRHQYTLGAPWNYMFIIEQYWYKDPEVIIRYLSSLAIYIPVFTISIICIPLYWKKLSWRLRELAILSAVWVVAPVVLIPLCRIISFPVANFRLIDMYTFIHEGLFATVGYCCFSGLLKPVRFKKILFLTVFALTVIPSVVLSVLYMNKVTSVMKSNVLFMYIPDDIVSVIHELSKVPPGSGVLALEDFAEVIADWEPVRVFVGKTPGYPDYWEKIYLTQDFYKGTLPIEKARKFLYDNDISYIFYGPYERAYTSTPVLYPDILTQVALSQTTTLFKVNVSVK
jgi:hypothetical protein